MIAYPPTLRCRVQGRNPTYGRLPTAAQANRTVCGGLAIPMLRLGEEL